MTSGSRTIICDISDKTFDPKATPGNLKEYNVRKAVRGVLLRNNTVALINVTKSGYHKFPGGGVETGESNEEAFKREVLEETGCDCEILESGPITIQYLDKIKLVQISYIFFGKVVGKMGEPNLEQGEKDEGFVLEWIPISKVRELWNKENPEEYEEKFIKFRDSEIFNYYEEKLLKKRD